MKTPALVIIKPDGVNNNLVGTIFSRFADAGLKLIALSLVQPSRDLVEEHYQHLKGQPFFDKTVAYFCGQFHQDKRCPVIVYYGEDAVDKSRAIAGATNPQEAAPGSLRGDYGRITDKGIFENVVHVSSDDKEAEREIKLWLNPQDIAEDLYPTKIQEINDYKKRIWV